MKVDFASPGDLPLLLEFEIACFPQQPWTEEALAGCFSDDRYLVLLLSVDETPVAYLIGWHVLDEAELARIGTLPSYRGHGYGQVILEAALREWHRRSVRQVFLDVRSTNGPALSLYSKAGFNQVGLRRNYYPDDDAVLMAKSLG